LAEPGPWAVSVKEHADAEMPRASVLTIMDRILDVDDRM